ncbi:MAG: ATP-binding protein [Rectinemataceae bacterium]
MKPIAGRAPQQPTAAAAGDGAAALGRDFARVLDSATDWIALMDRDGCYLAASRSYIAGNFRPGFGEYIGKRAEEILIPASAARENEARTRLLAGDELNGAEEILVTLQDGSQRRMSFTRQLFRDGDGNHDGILVQARDVTALAAKEEELRQAREEAESANRAKSSFLGNMSHEIRTPMNAIIGLAHLVQRDITDMHQRMQLAKIDTAAQHLMDLLNDIMDLSKIESGKLQLKETDFEVEHMLEDICNLIASRAESKGLEIIMDSPALPPLIHGDGIRLQKVLLNLITNAVKFSEAGSIVLRARLLSSDESGHLLRFEVSDGGIGISGEQKARLFLPFEQADGSTTRKYGGMGLGLAISRRLIELMGGKIGATSELGKGSTFWIEAPFGTAHGVTPNQPKASGMAGFRAFVVDDLEAARLVIVGMLEGLGFEVSSAPDAAAALDRLQEADATGCPFDLLLTDLRMPGIDGLELGKRLCALPIAHRPLAILITAYKDTVMRSTLAESGYTASLEKPLTRSRLRSSILGALGEHSAGPRTGEAQACRDAGPDIGPPIYPALVPEAGPAVDLTREGLETMPGRQTPEAAGPRTSLSPEDRSSITAKAARLDALLAGNDLAAVQAYQEDHRFYRRAFGPQASALYQEIESFNYDKARAILRQALGSLPGT